LQKIILFKDRYEYLRLGGSVGKQTFGFDRYINQMLYTSRRWLQTRDRVIIRDNGCDLGVSDYLIRGTILVHHMNPISVEDIENERNEIFDPEFLVCTTPNTHLAIHYGNEDLLPKLPITRRSNDTCPWLLSK
jgi:hypothetical protein